MLLSFRGVCVVKVYLICLTVLCRFPHLFHFPSRYVLISLLLTSLEYGASLIVSCFLITAWWRSSVVAELSLRVRVPEVDQVSCL